jgi:hypothetical protein
MKELSEITNHHLDLLHHGHIPERRLRVSTPAQLFSKSPSSHLKEPQVCLSNPQPKTEKDHPLSEWLLFRVNLLPLLKRKQFLWDEFILNI